MASIGDLQTAPLLFPSNYRATVINSDHAAKKMKQGCNQRARCNFFKIQGFPKMVVPEMVGLQLQILLKCMIQGTPISGNLNMLSCSKIDIRMNQQRRQMDSRTDGWIGSLRYIGQVGQDRQERYGKWIDMDRIDLIEQIDNLDRRNRYVYRCMDSWQ